MYQAINNYLIIRKPLEKQTTSGIYLGEQKEGVAFEFEVVAINEAHTAHNGLLGKTIYAHPRDCQELGKNGDGYYGALKVENILAVKA